MVAYGYEGSGKSFSMFGAGDSHGLIPRASDELFKKITDGYQISVQMIEIYNDNITDLLEPHHSHHISVK